MSRKYSQRGYQDEERGGDRKRSRRPPAEHQGPRGRGLGAPTESTFTCARCGCQATVEVASDSTCPKCLTDLHTCTNCRHFDSSARYECRETIPDRIAAKAKRNSCSLFSVKIVAGFARDRDSKGDDTKAAFDALFDL